MKFTFRKLRYIHLKDICDFFVTIAAFIPGMILKLFKKDIWLISERENDAHDNGYWFFKYVRENHPQKNAYYSISFTCKDYQDRIKPLGNAIRHGSFRHHIYFWAASKYISAHIGNGFPTKLMSRLFWMQGLLLFKFIFLQHGVTKDIPPFLLKENNKIDLFIAATEREREGIIKDLHYASEEVVCTGLCRYDNLYQHQTIPNRVLIMPTWRWWLQPEYGKENDDIIENIRSSNYYYNFMALFSNDRLIQFAKDHNLELVYFPHNQMQPFLEEFKQNCPNIICASSGEYDVQQALKDSAFLITDYSSIFFDFAYMKKPLVYFQFDQKEFREKHYSEGYYSYEKDGFGPIATTVDDVVDALIESYNKGFSLKLKYEQRVDAFFKFRDTDNTKRNYQVVELF